MSFPLSYIAFPIAIVWLKLTLIRAAAAAFLSFLNDTLVIYRNMFSHFIFFFAGGLGTSGKIEYLRVEYFLG